MLFVKSAVGYGLVASGKQSRVRTLAAQNMARNNYSSQDNVVTLMTALAEGKEMQEILS